MILIVLTVLSVLASARLMRPAPSTKREPDPLVLAKMQLMFISGNPNSFSGWPQTAIDTNRSKTVVFERVIFSEKVCWE
jgi:hypothetical protein